MNIHKLLLLLTLCFVGFFSCRKGGGLVTGPERVDPIKTAKGVATGAAASGIIGSAGGELTSGDGKLKVIVAAGTLAANTEFSIQPITNTLFDNQDRIAYRLLPDGIDFSKPVQLQFHYSDGDMLNTTEDALTIASQRADGAWTVLPTRLDKGTKTLTVETTHFSDWTVTGGLYLWPQTTSLGLGEKTMVQVVSVWDDESVLSPLGPALYSDDRAKLESIDNWRIVSGIGSIGVETGQLGKIQHEAEYGAPADMTPNSHMMTIGVDVKGFNLIKDPAAPSGVRRLNKTILLAHVEVVKEFIKAVIAGKTYMFTGNDAVATSSGGALLIGGRSAEVDLGINIMGDTTGTYNCSLHTGVQAFIYQSSKSFSTAYLACNGAGAYYANAPIVLTKSGGPGKWIEGKFSGSLFDNNANACAGAVPTVVTEIEFNVIRQKGE